MLRAQKIKIALSKNPRICRWCEKEFTPLSGSALSCKKCMTSRPYCLCGCGNRVKAIGTRGCAPVRYLRAHHPIDHKTGAKKCIATWKNKSKKEKAKFGERISKRMLKSYADGTRKVTTSQKRNHFKGKIFSRFGEMYCDSSWEKHYITKLHHSKHVVAVEKNIPVPYKEHGVQRTFLVDFKVTMKSGIIKLVEIKNSYLVKMQKRKIKAAMNYCKERGFVWKLITSDPHAGDKK